MTLWMPYSRDCFEAVGVKRPYDTFTLAYRLVTFKAKVSITLTFALCGYKLGFQEH